MGVGTSRTLEVQSAGILGVIFPHRDNETQLWFLGGKSRMPEMGRGPSNLDFGTATNCQTVTLQTVIAGHTNSTPNHVLTAPILATVFHQWARVGFESDFG